MKRRDFIRLLAGAAVAWPIASRAEQPAVPVIGYLSGRSPEDTVGELAAFQKGLSEGGFVNFAYSLDGRTFKPAGDAFPVTRGMWVGAQVGLFSVGAQARTQRSFLEADYFDVTAPGVGPY